jgi:hypothetical protein
MSTVRWVLFHSFSKIISVVDGVLAVEIYARDGSGADPNVGLRQVLIASKMAREVEESREACVIFFSISSFLQNFVRTSLSVLIRISVFHLLFVI